MTTKHTDLIRELRAYVADIRMARERMAAAADALEAMQAEHAHVLSLVREMHASDDAYGTGYYNSDAWLKPYTALRAAIDAARGQE